MQKIILHSSVKEQAVSFILLVFAFVLPLQTLQAQTNPEVLWAEQFEGQFNFQSKNIMTSDDFGNLYITGQFSGTVDFGDFTLTSEGETDVFVVKTDASGTVLWAEQFGGMDDDSGMAITTDASGNVYTTGIFWGTATFGTITLVSDNPWNIFVVKQGASGEVLWAKEFVGGEIAPPSGYGLATNGITTDSEGNIYTTGEFNTVTATFGDITLTRFPGINDTFVVKQDASGEVLWAKNFGTIGGSQTGTIGYVRSNGGLTTDASGNIYITGSLSGETDFGDTTLLGANLGDIFLMKMDTSGEVIWAKRFGGGIAHSSTGFSITIDMTGSVYVIGSFTGTLNVGTTTLTSNGYSDVFILKADSSGEALWAESFGGTNVEQGTSITTNASGKVYVTGDFSGVIDLAGTTLTSDGGTDVFVLKLDSSGTMEWAERFGSTGYEQGRGIIIDTEGDVYVTGHFQGTVDFEDTILTAAGDTGIFLIKLSPGSLFIGQNEPEEWKVYPNPVKDVLTIALPEPGTEVSVEVYNLLGQKVMQADSITDTKSLDLSGLTEGIYLLHINQNGINRVVKIKKQD